MEGLLECACAGQRGQVLHLFLSQTEYGRIAGRTFVPRAEIERLLRERDK